MRERLVFPKVHAEVLFKIAIEGVIAGLDFYMKNKRLYDKLPTEIKGEFENPQLRKKLEIIAAVEEKENLSGISIQSKQRRKILTEECADYVIEAYHIGLKISDERDYVFVRNPTRVA